MDKKISFRTWVSVFFGGIWQGICNIFSWKNKTPFWRVVWSIITICIVAFTGIVGYAFYSECYLPQQREEEYIRRTDFGDGFYFYDKDSGKGYIAESVTRKKLHRGIEWIAQSSDGDSLIVFSKGGKRGFLSANTAEIVLPAQYDAAWCFHDGVAGVCQGDSVFFIDHSGKPIYGRKFKREKGHNYVYYGDYFVNQVGDKFGLVDRRGRDLSGAIYEDLLPMPGNMWVMKLDGKMGALNDKGEVIIPAEYVDVEIHSEGGIVAMADDNSKRRLDYEGNLTDGFVYDSIIIPDYYTEELDEEGNHITKFANALVYSSNDHYGLMDPSGYPLTAPIYFSISPISADLFDCQIADYGGESLILNAKGQKVN